MALLSPDEILRQRGWLAQADRPLQDKIVAAARWMTLARGDQVFGTDDPPGGIYGIVSGGIGIESATQWHPLRLGHIMREGHWFGYGPAVTGRGRTMGYVAMEPSTLVQVPLSSLVGMMRDDPAIQSLLAAMALAGERLARLITGDLLIRDARRRIAAVLLRVTGAHEQVRPSGPEGFMLSQAQLGDMANASRNYTNRTLVHFRQQGWVELTYAHIKLLNVNALSNYAYHID